MASFDFIDATNKGYGFGWKNRGILARLAFFPFVVNFICLITIVAFDLEQNILRSGLVMLPSIFIQGWLIANVLRLAFFPDIGIALSGDPERDEKALHARSNDLMAGTLIYVLLKISILAFVGSLPIDPAMMENPPETSSEEPSKFMFIMAMLVLFVFLWFLRLYFLYIPVALGYPIMSYLKKLGGMASSLYLLAAWIMCFLPLLLLSVLGLDFLKVITQAGDAENALSTYHVLETAWRAFIEIFMEIMVALVVGHGIVMMMQGGKGSTGQKGK